MVTEFATLEALNEIDDAFHKVGYLKVAMPNTNVFNELNET